MIVPASAQAQTAVVVRYTEGLLRGFLVLRAMDGRVLAQGEMAQVAGDSGVKTHLVLRFDDGSIHDETVTFSQRDSFRLLTYRLVQKGPRFEIPMEMEIDRAKSEVVVRYTDENGESREERERLELPPDVMNGMIPVLVKNIPPGAKQTSASLVAATPKPRVVKLVVLPEGETKVMAGGISLKAMHYRMKLEIGGILEFLAPLVGMEPQDSHAWVVEGEAPAFIRLDGPLYVGGPIWRIEPASPKWPER